MSGLRVAFRGADGALAPVETAAQQRALRTRAIVSRRTMKRCSSTAMELLYTTIRKGLEAEALEERALPLQKEGRRATSKTT